MSEWTEIVVPVDESPDEALLREHIAPLVAALRGELSSWHYFWEPDLWVRLRWRGSREDGEARVRELLEGAGIAEWSFGEYGGDAEMMGAEMWERAERDFEHGAEHALRLLELEGSGELTREREFHWSRHVHCFTNQVFGTWSAEARLCARQARHRAALLTRASVNAELRPRLHAIIEALDSVLADAGAIEEAEQNVQRAWRERGRPDIATLLDLPDDYDYDPGGRTS